jgi:hypothetical protein
MSATRSPLSVPAPSRGIVGRFFGVLTSPRATYADIAARPGWLGALVGILAVTIAPRFWLLSTEIGQRAVVDQLLQAAESFGRTVSDGQYRQLQSMAPYARFFAAGSQVVGLPLAALVISGVAFAIFNGGFGETAAFRQVFAIVVFSGVVMGLRALFVTPLNYGGESLSNPTSLAAVIPLFVDNTFGARILGAVDLFLIWWIVSLSIGLGILYRRRTAPIAITMLVAYGVIALMIAAVQSMAGA